MGTQGLRYAVLGCGLLCGVSAFAQPAEDYLHLVRMYRTDPSPAAVSMSRMPPKAIDEGVRRLIEESALRCASVAHCSQQDLLAAAMLHADAAEQQIGGGANRAEPQIFAGRRLLRATRGTTTFTVRWYALVASLLLAHGYHDAAKVILSEGRTRYHEAPELFVVLGLITEWRTGLSGVGWFAGDLRGAAIRNELFDQSLGSTDPGSSTYRGSVFSDLERAAVDYRRALTVEPTHAAARIRLAWVHLLAGDARVWEDVSAEFLEAADAEARLVARLIRGTAAERERKFDVALAEYREAWRADAGSQTACLAVSSGQALNGDFAGADASAAECFALGNDADRVDSWTLFRMGLMDATTTRWLHDEARRP